MTQDEAIKRTSRLLQRIFHDYEEGIAVIRVAEKERDIDNLTSALDQLIMTCNELKQGLWNKE